jgi:DNA-binding CsgD family transcriptional regulator
MGEHNVFISWSGKRSKWVASAIREWLPVVVQAANPWMSGTDIEKGARGLVEIASKLEGIRVGVMCLTPENLNAPWILYEAGALSKTIDDQTRLCTYLLGGLQFQDIKSPLGMFQATVANKDETLRLVDTVNKAVSEQPVPYHRLERLFEKFWFELEAKLSSMPGPESVPPSKRPNDEIIAEILELARQGANRSELMNARLSALEMTSRRYEFGLGASSALSAREKQIVDLVADGLGNREIAEKLNISEHTVKNYLLRIFDKVGVSNRVELVLYAMRGREPDKD